ncbi:hypothetical protein Bca101_057562 [Brassica carinata]
MQVNSSSPICRTNPKSSSSPQNSGEGISTSDAEFVETTHSPPSLLPERLFAPNRYPDKPRLNIYSKANIIGSIVKSLAGTPELQCLLESLKCDPFVPQKARTGPLTLAASEDEGVVGRMWRKLFETEDLDVSVPEVLGMLADETLPVWKRLPLALIALVDGIIVYSYRLLLQLKQSPLRECIYVYNSKPHHVMDSLWLCNSWLSKQSRHLLKESLSLLRWQISWKNLMDATHENTLLTFEDVIEVEAVPEWEEDREDPTVQKLVELMRGGRKYKGSDFIGGDASLPPLIVSTKVTGGPSRPRRSVGKEPELSKSGEISEEVKSWFRRELSAQLGALREEIYGWTHPNESCSNARGRRGAHLVGQSEAGGNDAGGSEKKKRKVVGSGGVDQGNASGRKKSRSESTNIADASVGVDNQEMFNNDSSREVAQPDNAYNPPNIAEGGSTPPPDEPVLSKDPAAFESQSAIPTTSDAQEERHKFSDVEEVPTAGLNLLATMGGYFVEEIEEVKETVEGGVEKEAEDVGQSENDTMAMVLYGKPIAYVLPSEVVCHESHNVGNLAPHYKTPLEHDILSDFRTPDVAKVGKRRYQTRSATIQAVEGKTHLCSYEYAVATTRRDVPG